MRNHTRRSAAHLPAQIALTLLLLALMVPPVAAEGSTLSPREQEIEELAELFSIAAEHRRGSADEQSWQRLLEEATIAVEEQVPKVLARSDGYTDEFLSWAEERGMSLQRASYYALFGRGLRLKALAYASDPRATPLFMKALQSRNTLLTTSAVIGLVANGEVEAIPEIERESERNPDLRYILGALLMSLDDPRARATATRMIGDDRMAATLLEQVETKGRDKTLFGSEIAKYELD